MAECPALQLGPRPSKVIALVASSSLGLARSSGLVERPWCALPSCPKFACGFPTFTVCEAWQTRSRELSSLHPWPQRPFPIAPFHMPPRWTVLVGLIHVMQHFVLVLIEKTKSKYMFRGYTKKVIFGVTVIFGFFCVSTNQICLSNIYYICKTKNSM